MPFCGSRQAEFSHSELKALLMAERPVIIDLDSNDKARRLRQGLYHKARMLGLSPVPSISISNLTLTIEALK